MGDEAFFHCGISREIPPSLLSLKRVLDTLAATQEVPRHTRLYSRGISSVLPQLKKSPVSPSSSRDEGPFPCFLGKGISAFLSHLKRKWSQLETQEELRGHATVRKDPSSPIHLSEIRPDSPATTGMEPRISTHNRKKGLRAPWHL